ncbi:pilus assembly protein [Breoghania sp. L-A4]|uniref:pilus assembly protein n=1 Tax=Breoghania sp. L-A4 TaxID=2304600 RepID=UPI0013C3038D|nr:pilus assembly protein [Breoghania sp. L-A4]
MQTLGAAQSGSVVLIWALAMLVVIGAAGGAVDYGRAVNTRGLIANELDAAVLVGARYLATSKDVDKAKVLIKDTFAQTAAVKLAGIAEVEDLVPVIDSTNGVITATAQANITTAFVQLLGIKSIPVSVAAEVRFGTKYVELALVLDVTGSMADDPADMKALKTATKSIVDTLVPEGTKHQDSKVKISIVPYSQGVNLGEYATRVSDGNSGPRKCVTERYGAEMYTDAVYDYDGKDSKFFGGEQAYQTQAGPGANPDPWLNPPEACPSTSILPLTAKRVQLLKVIEDLEGHYGTAGQTGIAWGWYTLSPKWASLWPPESDPVAYGEDDTLKIAVIMTDGGFNMKYDAKEETSTVSCFNGGSPGWGWDWDWHKDKGCEKTTTTTTWYQTWYPSPSYDDEPAARGRKLCDEMKKSGVEVYSIFFETINSNFGKKLMNYCASSTDHFFYADSDSELVSAFSVIANKIQSIYLSK